MGVDSRELIELSTGRHEDDLRARHAGEAGAAPDSPQDDGGQGSHADAAQQPLPDFTTLGVATALRIRRESLGWSLPDVAAWLRIRLPYLEALEHGHPGQLPGNAYAVGFLRTYAAALGFPAEQVVSRFKRETRGVERKPELEFPAPVQERTVPAGAIVLTGIVVIIGAYIGWYRMVGHDPVPPERIPPVASVMPGVRSGPLPSPQIASMMPGAGPSQAPGQQKPSPATTDMTTALNMPSSADTSADSPAPSVMHTDPPTAPNPSDNTEATIPAPTPVHEPPAIRAIATSWIQVKGGDGKVLWDHIMQPGESWPLPADGAPFTLTVGNAGGITLAADGVTTVPLGRNGAVRRNIVLSPDTIRDGSIAAPASPSPASSGPQTPAGTGEDTDASAADAPVPLPPPPVIRPRVRPVQPPAHEPSADDLNAVQLQSMRGSGGGSGQH